MRYYSRKALEDYFGNIGINGHYFIDDLNAGKVPSIEIPEPHGRIIDEKRITSVETHKRGDVYSIEVEAPTILEASE